jgi:hypothetical protein
LPLRAVNDLPNVFKTGTADDAFSLIYLDKTLPFLIRNHKEVRVQLTTSSADDGVANKRDAPFLAEHLHPSRILLGRQALGKHVGGQISRTLVAPLMVKQFQFLINAVARDELPAAERTSFHIAAQDVKMTFLHATIAAGDFSAEE